MTLIYLPRAATFAYMRSTRILCVHVCELIKIYKIECINIFFAREKKSGERAKKKACEPQFGLRAMKKMFV